MVWTTPARGAQLRTSGLRRTEPEIRDEGIARSSNHRTWVGATRGIPSLLAAALVALLFVTPAAAAIGWTGPVGIGGLSGGCGQPQVAIDADGGVHVAAACERNIRYSANSGLSWSTTEFPHPSGAVDTGPQVTIDGSTLYLAFSRNPAGGCGADIDAGVYYRKRTLPDGEWSAATFVGKLQDQLQSFRVVASTIHATIMSIAGETIYETNAGGRLRRHAIPGATGLSSLRVGDDGRARIGYEAGGSLRYATFIGSRFQWSLIPGTIGRDGYPILVLDGANHAHLVWERMTARPQTPGCVDREPPPTPPDDGTYYATNASGSWTPHAARRITPKLGYASLKVDVTSGRVHVLLGMWDGGVRYYTKAAGGSWSGQWLSPVRAYGVALRLDQPRQRLVAVYAQDGTTANGIYALTKP